MLRPTVFNTAFCGWAAIAATLSIWWRSVVNTAGYSGHPALRASIRLFKIVPDDFVEPLDFIARLVALVPRPRVNLSRSARIIPVTHLLCGPAKAV